MARERSMRPRTLAGSRFGALISFALMFAFSAILLCWPMILNRQPFLLSDTATYIRGADAAVFKLQGSSTDWTLRFQKRFDQPGAAAPPQLVPATVKPLILAGRSVYYGGFLYVADRLGGLRLAAALQAILAAVCLLLTIRRFGQVPAMSAAKYLVIFTAVLSFGSSLAFFASYLEPDLACALALLSAAHLLTVRPSLDKRSTYFWFAVLVLCTLANSAASLILIVVGIAALIGSLRSQWVSKAGIALVAAGILVSVAGEALFDGVVVRQFGTPPVRPPFLMARLIADGPGREYLQERCPQVRFALCHHLGSISSYKYAGDSDSFLWSHNTSNGVFSAVDPAESRRVTAEQTRFVLAVFEDRPIAVLKSSIVAVAQQSTKWRLSEFNVLSEQREQFAEQLPPRVWNEQIKTLAFRQAMPVSIIEALSLPLAVLSLLAGVLIARRPKVGLDLGTFCGILLIGIASDIVICGAVSTPHARYLMRVEWLIPLAALIGMVGRGVPFTVRLPHFVRPKSGGAPSQI